MGMRLSVIVRMGMGMVVTAPMDVRMGMVVRMGLAAADGDVLGGQGRGGPGLGERQVI